MQSDSDVMLDQVRSIDNKKLTVKSLTVLTQYEMIVIEELMQIVLGIGE